MAHGVGLRVAHSCSRVADWDRSQHESGSQRPDTPVSEDRIRFMDGELIRWFADPIYGRGYPEDMLEDYERMGVLDSIEPGFIKPGDMDLIAQETDLLGINYYTRMLVSANSEGVHNEKGDVPQTDMGWELYPQGLYELLERIYREYHPKQLMVTENGASYADGPDEYGKVRDQRRIDYLHSHLKVVWDAIQAGIPVTAYLQWSLMDNFEWARDILSDLVPFMSIMKPRRARSKTVLLV